MFQAIEAYRYHDVFAYVSDGDGTVTVDLRIQEALVNIPVRGAFDVDRAVFHHPDGSMKRTFESESGTSNRETMEGLLHGPMNWFRHMTALPDSSRGMVEWIEAHPDRD